MLSPFDSQTGTALSLLTSGQGGRGGVRPIATDTLPARCPNSHGVAAVFGDMNDKGLFLGVLDEA